MNSIKDVLHACRLSILTQRLTIAREMELMIIRVLSIGGTIFGIHRLASVVGVIALLALPVVVGVSLCIC